MTRNSLDHREESLVPDANLGDGGLTPEQFRAAFRNHAAGVAVITADAGDGPVAITATSVFSVSATPPLLVFSVSELSSATPTILRADSVVVHLLGEDQLELARLGATSDVDRFADPDGWSRLPTGEPYYPAVPSWIRGIVVNRFEAGTSTLVVVQATHSEHPQVDSSESSAEAVRPLVYHNRTWHSLGDHSSLPAAP